METGTKISFGFKAIKKKTNLLPATSSSKEIEYITALENSSVKFVDEKPKVKDLVIPVLKDTTRITSAALTSFQLRRNVLDGIEEPISNPESKKLPIDIPENENIEKRAALELLQEVQNEKPEENDPSTLVVTATNTNKLEGAEASTLDDYDSIPVHEFGLGMLRGMGWSAELNKKKTLLDDGPMPRPKGLGLGAEKAIKTKELLIEPAQNEKLEIKKNAFIRIKAGKYKDMYGQIEGLDDHGGRVIVKLAVGGGKESLNEFLVQPVAKNEFLKYGKVINSSKFKEYTNSQERFSNGKETASLSNIDKNRNENGDFYKDKYNDKNSSRHRRTKTSSSNESSESELRHHHKAKKTKKKSNKAKKYYRNDSSEDEKKHKKKTKKSKRERSRS